MILPPNGKKFVDNQKLIVNFMLKYWKGNPMHTKWKKNQTLNDTRVTFVPGDYIGFNIGDTKLQPSRAKPGQPLGCSLVSFNFRCWILCGHPVESDHFEVVTSYLAHNFTAEQLSPTGPSWKWGPSKRNVKGAGNSHYGMWFIHFKIIKRVQLYNHVTFISHPPGSWVWCCPLDVPGTLGVTSNPGSLRLGCNNTQKCYNFLLKNCLFLQKWQNLSFYFGAKPKEGFWLTTKNLVFVDIGVNIGVHSLFMAANGIKVFGVDPSEENLLRVSLKKQLFL